MREKIIITGSSGFLGTALVKYLLKTKKYDVVGIDRKEQTVKDKHYIHIKEDLTKDIPKIDGNIYAVVHLAAIPGVRESHEQFFDYAINNIYVTQKVLKLCIEQWKPQKFLFASSSSIYNSGLAAALYTHGRLWRVGIARGLVSKFGETPDF